ncbi:MAG: transposase [Betaproteobacteria bacterium]|uniref:transposase n=1 Tax=Ferrovum sp. PN-J185 TaxID=1356306 RepID=UPI0018D47A89|nr:transposase [Ferrovum sp. PN-J185]MDE1892642.1 transposase [Betaproteobacteria bacterium]MDE2057156.1 transposase [Betaproteobacteria bacterium]
MFRRFIGLSLSEAVPDHSSFCRFRNYPQVVALQAYLLAEINRQLSEQGLYIHSGEISIFDASVIQAQLHHPGKGKEE